MYNIYIYIYIYTYIIYSFVSVLVCLVAILLFCPYVQSGAFFRQRMAYRGLQEVVRLTQVLRGWWRGQNRVFRVLTFTRPPNSELMWGNEVTQVRAREAGDCSQRRRHREQAVRILLRNPPAAREEAARAHIMIYYYVIIIIIMFIIQVYTIT